MEAIRDDENIGKIDLRVTHHEVYLQNDADLFPAMLQETLSLAERIQGMLQQDRGLMLLGLQAQARRSKALRLLKRSIRVLESALEVLVEKRRDDARYRRLFGVQTLTEITRMTLPLIVEMAEQFMQTLNEESFVSLRADHQARLQQAIAAGRGALEIMAQDQQQGSAFKAQLAALRQDANTLLHEHYGKLLQAFPNDKDSVEEYFAKLYANKKKKADADAGQTGQPGQEGQSAQTGQTPPATA